MGLLHAGRDRRRRELLAALEQQTPLPLTAESKGGNAVQQRQAIMATIWSFVATAAFAFGFVLPYKGRKATLDFITGFLVEKVRAPLAICANAHRSLFWLARIGASC